jgi:hypothetical protein
MPCRQCGKPVKVVNEYIPITCGGSSCQEAEYHANMARTQPKKRKLQPKEGAKKADGTRWTSQPGGIQKLEIPAPTGNEHMFARLLCEMVAVQERDPGQCVVFMQDVSDSMNLSLKGVHELLERAVAVVDRVKNKQS